MVLRWFQIHKNNRRVVLAKSVAFKIRILPTLEQIGVGYLELVGYQRRWLPRLCLLCLNTLPPFWRVNFKPLVNTPAQP
jgi:hypothetical protein